MRGFLFTAQEAKRGEALPGMKNKYKYQKFLRGNSGHVVVRCPDMDMW